MKSEISFQDFFGKLVVDAEVRSSQLPAAAPHLDHLLIMFKLGHNRSRSAGIWSLPSQAVDSVKSNVFHCISWKFKLILDKVFNR